MDAEAGCESAHQEMSCVHRRLSDVEDELRVKERNFHVTLEHTRQTEYQLIDDRRQLEQELDEAGTRLSETRVVLSAAEGRVRALESELSDVDGARVECETRLASVMASVRRFVSVGHHTAVMRSRYRLARGQLLRCRSLSALHSDSPAVSRAALSGQ